MEHVVETGNAIHDKINVANVIINDGIEAKLVIDRAANGRLSELRKRLPAVFIRRAEHRSVKLKLRPLLERAVLIFHFLVIGTAELVLLAEELVSAKDGEHTEDENDEEEDAHEAWYRLQHRVDLLLNLWQLVNRA